MSSQIKHSEDQVSVSRSTSYVLLTNNFPPRVSSMRDRRWLNRSLDRRRFLWTHFPRQPAPISFTEKAIYNLSVRFSGQTQSIHPIISVHYWSSVTPHTYTFPPALFSTFLSSLHRWCRYPFDSLSLWSLLVLVGHSLLHLELLRRASLVKIPPSSRTFTAKLNMHVCISLYVPHLFTTSVESDN